MTPPIPPDQQLIRLASDNQSIYQDARSRFLTLGPSTAATLIEGLEDERLGSVCHWRILLLLREFALPSTFPAILKAFRSAVDRKDPVVLPGAMEALAVFPEEEAAPPLISVLQSDNVDNAIYAAALLASVGGGRAVEALAGVLTHRQVSVRKAAVQALLRIDTTRAHEILQRHRTRENDPGILALMNPSR
jgi:HEAT repeat protein